ncbi:hypothetical protein FOB64_004336 [Candida albicans]|nr:hypothetical protein FOB64_004336 [Candida albicans]
MKATTFTLLLSIATAINAAAFEDSRLKALFARDAEISFGATLSAEISHGFGHHHGHTADLSSEMAVDLHLQFETTDSAETTDIVETTDSVDTNTTDISTTDETTEETTDATDSVETTFESVSNTEDLSSSSSSIITDSSESTIEETPLITDTS